MSAWLEALQQVEALEDVVLERSLLREMECHAKGRKPERIDFHTPTFKTYHSPELPGCGKPIWPAISITGGACKLQCDHCKAKVLEPMLPATTPEALWRSVNEQIERGAQGVLLTGGSNHRNEVEYDPFYPVVSRIKQTFPHFRIALHTALVDAAGAQRMADAGVDVAMLDVIGAQDTIAQVYHLRRSVDDFEQTLANLTASGMRVVPHIVLGLHYGRLLGEWAALEIVRRHRPHALVLVVAMPFYAPRERPFVVPDVHQIGRFFQDARITLPDLPLLLGCARPAGVAKTQIDAYAVLAGLNGIAHPAEGVVELALRLGREAYVSASCCSIAVTGLAAEQNMARLALRDLLRRHLQLPARASGLAGIRVVAA